jgi:hypothetical protein
MSRASERAARERADEILRAAHGRGEDVGGDYGAGRMTKAQKKSQEKNIPWTEGPQTRGQRVARKLWG